jgi:lipase
MSAAPLESRVVVSDVELAVFEWPGDEPAVFFCHATGFHARIWNQVIANLPGRRCVAFDARGHGQSSKPAPPYPWRRFGEDVAALTESLGLAGVVGVGHSLGGHAVTLGAALNPDAFAALLLFDPVIRANDRYSGPWKKIEFVAKRRNQWTSAGEMFERFKHRPPFDAWDRRVLRDYCEHALAVSAHSDGETFVLACSPDTEVSVYQNSTALESNIYSEVASIQVPVYVVRSGRYRDSENMMGSSPTAPNLAATFAHARDICFPEFSHLMPMESPQSTAKIISDALALL